jgi:hypothetical protein
VAGRSVDRPTSPDRAKEELKRLFGAVVRHVWPPLTARTILGNSSLAKILTIWAVLLAKILTIWAVLRMRPECGN